tara:strand:+ start:367 stop:558 length:192 start_codon:yes stop_codon:yes gene_type:complete
MQLAETGIETGVPGFTTINSFLIQIRNFFNMTAKTGRANHRAICAGETTIRNILPVGMLQLTY